MAEKFLVLNADGYGFTPGVNEGIARTFETGLVTSTSCTPNFGHLGDAGKLQRRFPNVSFGIHFNLSVGTPLSPPGRVSSLLGTDGRFLGDKLLPRILKGRVVAEEVETELAAQAAVLADQGVRISHWDGHQNKHLWPLYFEAGCRVARRFGIVGIRTHRRLLYTTAGPISWRARTAYYASHPARVITHVGGRIRTHMAERAGYVAADRLITPGYADDSHKSLSSFWEVLAKTLPAGFSEVYCHPGFPDALLRANARYVDQRADEVAVLTNPDLKSLFEKTSVRLINFFDLAAARKG